MGRELFPVSDHLYRSKIVGWIWVSSAKLAMKRYERPPMTGTTR